MLSDHRSTIGGAGVDLSGSSVGCCCCCWCCGRCSAQQFGTRYNGTARAAVPPPAVGPADPGPASDVADAVWLHSCCPCCPCCWRLCGCPRRRTSIASPRFITSVEGVNHHVARSTRPAGAATVSVLEYAAPLCAASAIGECSTVTCRRVESGDRSTPTTTSHAWSADSAT